jgi:hypothetical protein
MEQSQPCHLEQSRLPKVETDSGRCAFEGEDRLPGNGLHAEKGGIELMSSEAFNPAAFSLHVDWYGGGGAPTEFRLSDVERVRQLIMDDGLWPNSFASDCVDLSLLLEQLAPLANPDLDEVVVNGTTVVVAHHIDGGHAFVPYSDFELVDVLASGSSTWLGAGPCVFVQGEQLLRLGDLYWVDTSGDSSQQRLVVSRFADAATGLAAAVAASCFFSFSSDGELVCELDEWPQEEE